MDYGKNFVKTIKTIEEEIKIMNKKKKDLMAERERAKLRLYNWMIKTQQEEYEGIKKDKIKPKENTQLIRKKKKEKKEDIIRLMMNAGIPDPIEMYDQVMAAQKSKKNTL